MEKITSRLLIIASLCLLFAIPAWAEQGIGESNIAPVDTLTSVLISCQTHPDQSLWYNNNDPVFTWTAPFITPTGYYFILDHSPSTSPTDMTGQYILEARLTMKDAADGTWYLHIVAELGAGELEPYVAHYQINIDTSLTVTSTSHPDQSACYQKPQVELAWSTLHPSSVANYYYTLDNKKDTVPSQATGTAYQDTKILLNVSDGAWYFHIVWEDKKGNIGEKTVHYAINVDSIPPTAVREPKGKVQGEDIVLTWLESVDQTCGVAYYQVYRSESQDVIGSKISADGKVTVCQYVDVGVAKQKKTFYYTILPIDRAGNKQTKGDQIAVNTYPSPSLSILTPAKDQALPAGTTSVALTMSITNHTGAWHWKLDAPFPTSGSAGGNRVASGNAATITGLQDGKSYTASAALVDGNGNVLNPPVTASVTFSVSAAPPKPDFTITAIKTDITVTAGESAIYIIELEGKNGFNDSIELSTRALHPNITGSFDPDKVSLSKTKSSETSQLTLSIPKDFNAGDYTFTVNAIAESLSAKKLTLTLKIKPTSIIKTSLSVLLDPKVVPFNGRLKLSGELMAESDAKTGLVAISVTFTAPSGKTYLFDVKTGEDGNYQLENQFSPDQVGLWSIKVQFDGNSQLKPSERTIPFTVIKGQGKITFSNNTSERLGTEITVSGQLDPGIAGELISLKILRPDKSSESYSVKTEASGIFRYPGADKTLRLDKTGDWEITAEWKGNSNYNPASKTHIIHVPEETGKAIIVLGASNRDDQPDWEASRQLAEYVYGIFIKRGLKDEDIYFLSPDRKGTKGADHETSMTELETAVTVWAKPQINALIPLFIYILAHNDSEKCLIERRESAKGYLSPEQLDTWLDQLSDEAPVTVIIEACYSGSFIRASDGKKTSLVSPNRAVITSARSDERSYIGIGNLYSFSKYFFDYIEKNRTISEAFSETEKWMERLKYSHPQMDTNGDGNVNDIYDHAKVKQSYIPASITKAMPPEITKITQSQTLKGSMSLEIRVKIDGMDITRVYATVIPPGFNPGSMTELRYPQVKLAEVSGRDSEYTGTYTGFTAPGEYLVIVDAENMEGSADPALITITVPPGGAITKGDVNNDGKVNAKDALLVSQFAAGIKIPTDEQKQASDMDDNGIINSKDTILLLRKSAESAVPGTGIAQSLLLQNYPNPFNPETWIPYQLKNGSDVTIRIYSASVGLVRELKLGYKPAGIYMGRDRSAYWDGRDEHGAPVASGVYFYSIQADDFTAVRKLIVMK